MAFPVTLNGRTYTLTDFEGTNYVDGLPDAFEDFVTHAGDIYNSTSTTSNSIGTGSKTFTVEANKPYQAGTPLRIADAAAPSTNFLDTVVTSYSGTTLVVNSIGYGGSGTKTSWTVNIGGAKTVDGTLGLSQGGTGATDAAGARTNIDVYSKADADSRFLNVSGEASDVTMNGNVTIGDASSDTLTINAALEAVSTIKLNGDYPVGTDNVALGSGALNSVVSGGNNNVALGTEALNSLTLGDANTAVGERSAATVVDSYYITAVGYRAGESATAEGGTFVGGDAGRATNTGTNNVFVGREAGVTNTTGSDLVAIGYNALRLNTIGDKNVAVGRNALHSSTDTDYATAVGYEAGYYNDASHTTAFGYRALYNNTTGFGNTGLGSQAGQALNTGGNNTLVGYAAGVSITSGANNTAFGRDALFSQATNGGATAVGYRALFNDTAGSNTAVGGYALNSNTSGSSNVALGYQAGSSNQTGVYLTAVGYQAGYSSIANNNTFIGRKAGYGATGATNTYVGYDAGAATNAQSDNTGVGALALTSSTSGSNNAALGRSALNDATSAIKSTAVGAFALNNVTSGIYNTALGYDAGGSMVGNSENVFVGYISGQSTTGGKNTFVGSDSGKLVTSGANNTIIGRYNGNQGGIDIRTSNNNIVLSDGDGNPRLRVDSDGRTFFGSFGNESAGGASSGATASGFGYFKSARNTLMATLTDSGQSYEPLGLMRTGSTGNLVAFWYTTSTQVGTITTNGSSTSYNTTSDYRLKENVVNLTGATTRLKQLEPKRFNFIVDGDTTVDGFLAHEVQTVVPEAITGTKDAVDAEGNPEYQGIDQSKLVPLLVATIKELEARITALESA